VPVNAGARLRVSGICNTFGRGAIIRMPFVVVLTLGVEPKKRRLEEIKFETAGQHFPAEVQNP
jgi:hypothetical protein